MHKAKTLLARLAAAAIALSVAIPFGVAFADDALGDVGTPNVWHGFERRRVRFFG